MYVYMKIYRYMYTFMYLVSVAFVWEVRMGLLQDSCRKHGGQTPLNCSSGDAKVCNSCGFCITAKSSKGSP